MNEEQFRARFRRAVGDAPPNGLQHRLAETLADTSHRRAMGGLGAVAATVLIIVVAGLAGWRLAVQRSSLPAAVTPSAPVQPTSTPFAAVDPGNCRLPVVVMRESGPPGAIANDAGFVDTQTGKYVRDGGASLAGLPGGAFEGTNVKPAQPPAPRWYDATVRRWLPVGPSQVSPDGRNYTWVRLLPVGSNFSSFKRSELHRYDLSTAADHLLWTYDGLVMVSRWDASGILAVTSPPPPTGGDDGLWLVDPRSGTAARQPGSTAPSPLTELPGDRQNGGFGYGSFGSDAHGRTIYWIGSRNPGDREWIFYESAPGQRVWIYKGTHGDATGFDPAQALADQTGIWFSDYETRGLWHWDSAAGLKKIPVTGQPGQLPGPNSALYVNPAGPCM